MCLSLTVWSQCTSVTHDGRRRRRTDKFLMAKGELRYIRSPKKLFRLFCLARRCSQHRPCCVKEPYPWGFGDTCSNCTACVWRSTLISLALEQYSGSLLNDILMSLISPILPSQMTVVRELRGFFGPHHLH